MSPSPILAIDVGNSRIKFGLFDRPNDGHALPEPAQILAVRHGEEVPWEAIGRWLGTSPGEAAQTLLAGVKPDAIERLLTQWPKAGWPRPRVIRDPRELPLTVRVEAPHGVGIDRLLGAVGANALRPAGVPAIVVSSGTATTIDLIAPDGGFEGGAILPGFELAARSLHEQTALLPLVPVDELRDPALPPVGRNTRAAIRSGILFGQLGAVKELIARLSASLDERTETVTGRSSGVEPMIFVTGGNGPLLTPHLGAWAYDERELPLRGLAKLAISSGQIPAGGV